MKYRDELTLDVISVSSQSFEVDHGGTTVGVKMQTTVNKGDRVIIAHNGITKEGSLRNPVYVKHV